MLAKKHNPFVNLKQDRSKSMGVEVAPSDESRGPMLYINDINLPVTDEDLNNSLVAEVKLTPRRISKSTTNGETSVSYDMEVTGIRFKS